MFDTFSLHTDGVPYRIVTRLVPGIDSHPTPYMEVHLHGDTASATIYPDTPEQLEAMAAALNVAAAELRIAQKQYAEATEVRS